MKSTLKRKKTAAPADEAAFKRLPYEVQPLVEALSLATHGLVDDTATHLSQEEMYAVLDVPSFTCAYALLCLGVARYATRLALVPRETPTQILLEVRGVRRHMGTPLSPADILPSEEALSALLSDCLRKNHAEYALRDDGATLCLTVAIPRFLSERYDVCAVSADRIIEIFYDTMRISAGYAPRTLAFTL